MIDLEKAKYAKIYIEKLANGINPLDDSIIRDDDIVNNIHISRCLFFVADALNQIILGNNESTTKKTTHKVPFSITKEEKNNFPYSEKPLTLTEISNLFNSIKSDESIKKVSYSTIAKWFVSVGLMEEVEINGKSRKSPTEYLYKLGVYVETRYGQRGPYEVNLYSAEAQKLIVDNIESIIAYDNKTLINKTGEWTDSEDYYRLYLYDKKLPLNIISKIINRDNAEVYNRFKYIDLEISDKKDEDNKDNSSDKIKTLENEKENLSCKDCMLYRNDECIGAKEICNYFKQAPNVPKEEIENWPDVGDATYFKTHKYGRN